MQERLTRIDGKNCTQIINLGHPRVTKKVMHIKITHLFELYISTWAVNRVSPHTWDFYVLSLIFMLFPVHLLFWFVVFYFMMKHIHLLVLFFLRNHKGSYFFHEIRSPHLKISCNKKSILGLLTSSHHCTWSHTNTYKTYLNHNVQIKFGCYEGGDQSLRFVQWSSWTSSTGSLPTQMFYSSIKTD